MKRHDMDFLAIAIALNFAIKFVAMKLISAEISNAKAEVEYAIMIQRKKAVFRFRLVIAMFVAMAAIVIILLL